MNLHCTDWYEAIPKVELHVHLEGAIPPEALFELIKKYGGYSGIRNISELERHFVYSNFSHFIELWSWKNGFLRDYQDFTFIAEMVARDLKQQNVVYAEMFYSPSAFTHIGLSVQYLTQAVRDGLDRVPDIDIVLIADFVRDDGPEVALVTLDALSEVRQYGVCGIGIGGSEHAFPARPFARLFQTARNRGFHLNAHAGEAAGAESIWSAIRDLGVERIGHGTRAYEDPELVEYLASSKIPLEMCPVSNVRTRVVADLHEHPIRRFMEAGVIVTANSDDPKMFQTSLSQEYRSLAEECGWTKEEITLLIRNAIQSSWATQQRKSVLLQQLDRFLLSRDRESEPDLPSV